jgi:hypothetical protein
VSTLLPISGSPLEQEKVTVEPVVPCPLLGLMLPKDGAVSAEEQGLAVGGGWGE